MGRRKTKVKVENLELDVSTTANVNMIHGSALASLELEHDNPIIAKTRGGLLA